MTPDIRTIEGYEFLFTYFGDSVTDDLTIIAIPNGNDSFLPPRYSRWSITVSSKKQDLEYDTSELVKRIAIQVRKFLSDPEHLQESSHV